MQTFLPSPNFIHCAEVLDPVRLRRQIQECAWIAKALANQEGNSSISSRGSHPVLKLWRHPLTGVPFIRTLRKYQVAMHLIYKKTHTHAAFYECSWMNSYPEDPPFVWPEELHESHRRALLDKNPSYYGMALASHGLTTRGPFEGYLWSAPILVPHETPRHSLPKIT